ncbi:hypothetical protein K373_02257 [Streptomyces sp. DvalAA-21]|nr:hypothetical protein K373_02257 [Streptomyces sp. DvalAA-21]RAJ36252.1 hypothetical protein K351_02004 [Streptomyces sp. DpondAA-E10]SCE43273.1 hypothetical protein GA0115235_119625 [Streptomyces sp. DpondAA-F4a]
MLRSTGNPAGGTHRDAGRRRRDVRRRRRDERTSGGSYSFTPKNGSSGSGSFSLHASAPVFVSASFTQV